MSDARYSILYLTDNHKAYEFIDAKEIDQSFNDLQGAVHYIRYSLKNATRRHVIKDNKLNTYWLNLPTKDNPDRWVEHTDYYALSERW